MSLDLYGAKGLEEVKWCENIESRKMTFENKRNMWTKSQENSLHLGRWWQTSHFLYSPTWSHHSSKHSACTCPAEPRHAQGVSNSFPSPQSKHRRHDMHGSVRWRDPNLYKCESCKAFMTARISLSGLLDIWISCFNSTSCILPENAPFQRPKQYCTGKGMLHSQWWCFHDSTAYESQGCRCTRDAERERKRDCTCWVVGWLVCVPGENWMIWKDLMVCTFFWAPI